MISTSRNKNLSATHKTLRLVGIEKCQFEDILWSK